MRATALKVHNFRSILEADIELPSYALLVGTNNAGKSNVLTAVRAFYEKGYKFDGVRDFPKLPTSDSESWVEIEYEPSATELHELKAEYQTANGRFRVRKYFRADPTNHDDEGKPRDGIYAYVDGTLSGSRFYGAKNIQQGKLGSIIYIPAAGKLDEHTKLSGPSPLRDLLSVVLRGVLKSSTSYQELTAAFESFESKLKKEQSAEGHSLERLEKEISDELKRWGTKFELTVSSVGQEDLIKSLVDHRVLDGLLNEPMDSLHFGQGFQRQLIFTLIRLAARYEPGKGASVKKEFAPALTWLLFEEPEAFLHPTQSEHLNDDLRKYASTDGQQVLACSHSPVFASLNIEDLPAIIRVNRDGPASTVGQVRTTDVPELLQANQACVAASKAVGIDTSAEDETVDMESIKYALWLNPLRANLFFATRVLLVEGPSESTLLRYLIAMKKIPLAPSVAIIDTLGKWNTHRFMNLLSRLGIPHSVLFDRDGGDAKSMALENVIREAASDHTVGVDCFEMDLETYLEVPKCKRPDRKPQYLMWMLKSGHVAEARVDALCQKVAPLLTATAPVVPTPAYPAWAVQGAAQTLPSVGAA